jgi:hypothetical protein
MKPTVLAEALLQHGHIHYRYTTEEYGLCFLVAQAAYSIQLSSGVSLKQPVEKFGLLHDVAGLATNVYSCSGKY